MKTDTLDHVKEGAVKAKESRTRDGEGGLLRKPAEWWDNGRTFLVEVRAEMKRVTWPSRREVYATTLVVILTSIFFGVYLWGVDMALNRIVGTLFRSLGGQ